MINQSIKSCIVIKGDIMKINKLGAVGSRKRTRVKRLLRFCCGPIFWGLTLGRACWDGDLPRLKISWAIGSWWSLCVTCWWCWKGSYFIAAWTIFLSSVGLTHFLCLFIECSKWANQRFGQILLDFYWKLTFLRLWSFSKTKQKWAMVIQIGRSAKLSIETL